MFNTPSGTADIGNEEEEALLSEKTEISEEAITLLDMKVHKGATFHKESIFDVQTYYKPTENFYSCHPPGVTKRLFQGRSMKASDNKFLTIKFWGKHEKLRETLSTNVLEKQLREVKFSDRKASLQQKNRDAHRRILPFVTQYHSALPSLKTLIKRKWHLIQNQPYFTEPLLISQRKIPKRHSV